MGIKSYSKLFIFNWLRIYLNKMELLNKVFIIINEQMLKNINNIVLSIYFLTMLTIFAIIAIGKKIYLNVFDKFEFALNSDKYVKNNKNN